MGTIRGKEIPAGFSGMELLILQDLLYACRDMTPGARHYGRVIPEVPGPDCIDSSAPDGRRPGSGNGTAPCRHGARESVRMSPILHPIGKAVYSRGKYRLENRSFRLARPLR